MATLPEELLSTILSHLEQPQLSDDVWRGCSKQNRALYRTLISLSATSKQFQRLVTPILYRTVEIYGSGENVQHPPHLSGYSSNLKPFLRSLLQRPELVSFVKNLKVEMWAWDKIMPRAAGNFCRPDEAVVQLSGRAIDRTHLSPNLAASVVDGTRQGHEDAELALLLALLSPSIETLHLPVRGAWDRKKELLVYNIMPDMFACAREQDLPPPFPHLKTVGIRNETAPRHDCPFNMTEINFLLECPALETVRAHSMSIWQGGWLRPSASLRRLQTHCDEVDVNGIGAVCENFPNLKELDITLEEGLEDYGELSMQNEVGEALREHAGQLEKLVWDVRLLYLNSREDCTCLGDLSPLHNLRELVVSVRSILGLEDDHEASEWAPSTQLADRLPTSLETIVLVDCRAPPDPNVADDDDTEVWGWMRILLLSGLLGLAQDGRFARLRRIEIREMRFLDHFIPAKELPGWEVLEFDKSRGRGDTERGKIYVMERE